MAKKPKADLVPIGAKISVLNTNVAAAFLLGSNLMYRGTVTKRQDLGKSPRAAKYYRLSNDGQVYTVLVDSLSQPDKPHQIKAVRTAHGFLFVPRY